MSELSTSLGISTELVELSKKTLKSYVKAAKPDRDMADKYGDTLYDRGAPRRDINNQVKRSNKRDAGITIAKKRLKSQYKEDLAPSLEISDTLLELSKKTLKSYVKDASRDVKFLGKDSVRQDHRGDSKGRSATDKKANKRLKGIDTAVDKLTGTKARG